MIAIVIAIFICIAAAALEGVLSGKDVKKRFAELKQPKPSPSFAVWIAISIYYYLMCLLLLRGLISAGLDSPWRAGAFAILIVIMLANGGWNYLFFQVRSPRYSFLAFLIYAVLVLGLTGLAAVAVPLESVTLLPYLVYLVYAIWWSHQIWRLNPDSGESKP